MQPCKTEWSFNHCLLACLWLPYFLFYFEVSPSCVIVWLCVSVCPTMSLPVHPVLFPWAFSCVFLYLPGMFSVFCSWLYVFMDFFFLFCLAHVITGFYFAIVRTLFSWGVCTLYLASLGFWLISFLVFGCLLMLAFLFSILPASWESGILVLIILPCLTVCHWKG